MKDPEQFYLLQISKLEDELKAAQKDTARLDWMIKNKRCILGGYVHGFWVSDYHGKPNHKLETARGAIDAAMEDSK